MASYPFAPTPTLAQFLERARAEFGVEVKELTGTFESPSGHDVGRAYLVREVDGKKYVASLPALEAGDRLLHHPLRSLCIRLGIPPAEFGLTLD